MIFTHLFKKKDPEDPALLKNLHPVRFYASRGDVLEKMSALRGIAVDGLLIEEYEIDAETEDYFRVRVVYDDYLNKDDETWENWYFFKDKES